MRLALMILGAVFALVGTVWLLQGFNFLPGSFMTGQLQWAAYGAVLLAVGIALIFVARRRKKS